MKTEIKKKWVKALRSRKYRQIDSQLSDGDNGRCCLGVLCDVVKKDVHGEWVGEEFSTDSGTYDILLPEEVSKFCGFRGKYRENPKIKVRGRYYNLSCLNDGEDVERHSFKQIADLIEKNL